MKNNLKKIKKYFSKKIYSLLNFFKKEKFQKYSSKEFIFLIREIEKMDEIFFNYKMYSALIYYKINEEEKIDIENIKNNIKNLKKFNCEISNFNGKLEIKMIEKKGEKR